MELPDRERPYADVTMARSVSRGMLQVRGVTYRIERTEPHCYSVVRLLDDVEVGTFRTLPALRLQPISIEDQVMRDIVRAAMRSARTSAVMHVAPVFQPDGDRDSSLSPDSSGNLPALSPDSSGSIPALSPRSSSSVPPPESAMA